MPIRKSITGVRPVTPILVPAAKGKPVAVPRKTAFVPVPKRPRTIPSEETAIKKAFAAIPIGQVILETTWSRDHTLPFLKKKFTIWELTSRSTQAPPALPRMANIIKNASVSSWPRSNVTIVTSR